MDTVGIRELKTHLSHHLKRVRAFMGALGSNTVTTNWVLRCDVDGDKDIDLLDVRAVQTSNGQNASGPYDPRDGNGDGRITVADLRYCQLRLTPAP